MSVDCNAAFTAAIVIETNLYAGNFERDLCAYATGAYGQCDVGQELAELADTELAELGYEVGEISDYTEAMCDDRGCYRPTSIWNSGNNTGYNDVIIFLQEPLSDKAYNVVKERVEEFAARSRANIGKKTDYRDRTQIQVGDLQIKRIYMLERKLTVVDTIIKE